ncbi:hypothetical protein M2T79_02515 [Elizabethkingia miricola]|uniref:hypothetical protein n=1 Tax=Elizabethkingia miricola TaxID=172045 RepID=UPI0020198A75|nr:hypothetical protein [Elizabethkingia miricola]MCL1655454.1 hypothetical protein [Elizabethkingia miricola]
MNLVDCYVTEVIKLNHNTVLDKWVVEVKYDCYGRIDTTMLLFNTEEEAKSVKIGYEFLA